MKKIVLLLMAAILLPFAVDAKKNDAAIVPEYQCEGAGTTSDASRQVKVTILSKKKDVTDADLGKCAVHAVLFRDMDDKTNAGYGSAAVQKSIMGSPTAMSQHIDFFEPFFRNGDCNAYVQAVNDPSVVKSGKGYKISAVVKVNTTQLRKDLEKQGMVKNLGSGW